MGVKSRNAGYCSQSATASKAVDQAQCHPLANKVRLNCTHNGVANPMQIRGRFQFAEQF
jgi:hypothetical protein